MLTKTAMFSDSSTEIGSRPGFNGMGTDLMFVSPPSHRRLSFSYAGDSFQFCTHTSLVLELVAILYSGELVFAVVVYVDGFVASLKRGSR